MFKRKRKGEVFRQQIKNDQSSESHRFGTEYMVASEVMYKTKYLLPFSLWNCTVFSFLSFKDKF